MDDGNSISPGGVLGILKARAFKIAIEHKERTGDKLMHSHALDLVAKELGFKNWNVVCGIAKQDHNRIHAAILKCWSPNG